MLGLVSGLASATTRAAASFQGAFTPESISNIALWLKVNTNITADENSAAVAYGTAHTSNGGDMVNADRINAWNAAGSTSINAVQTTTGDKPRWDTSSGNLGSVRSPGANKHMDLSSAITFDANTDFTVVIRFKPDVATDSRALLGDTDSEFIRNHDGDTIRLKTDAGTNDFNSGTALESEKIVTMIMVRSDGATGNINCFMRSNVSSYFDGTATGTAFGSTSQDNTEIVISNIMAQADNSGEFDGNVYDIIIYDGTAVTSAQRQQLFDYIDAQDYPQ